MEKLIYERDNHFKIIKENEFYFIEELQGFKIYKWVERHDMPITEILMDEVRELGVNEFLEYLHDNSFKDKLVDFKIELLKKQDNYSLQFIEELMNNIKELQE